MANVMPPRAIGRRKKPGRKATKHEPKRVQERKEGKADWQDGMTGIVFLCLAGICCLVGYVVIRYAMG